MKKYIYIVACAFLAVSCLFENDMAYPDVPALIEDFEVEGQVSIKIDNDARSVSLVIGEREELYHLRLMNITLSEGAVLVDSLPEYLDLLIERFFRQLTVPRPERRGAVFARRRAEQRIVRCCGCDGGHTLARRLGGPARGFADASKRAGRAGPDQGRAFRRRDQGLV